ncbi:MAG: signal peptide peptidase SppA [Bacteroidota bacterium]
MTFGKSFLASLLAFLVGAVLFAFLFFIIISAFIAAAGSSDPIAVKDNTILHLQLNKSIVENARVDEPDFDFGNSVPMPIPGLAVSSGKMGLYQILMNIRQATEDERIKGMYLNLQTAVPTGWANLTAIREALQEFKDAGKFIYAYSELYTENSYYLASVADSIFMPAEGILEHNGIGGIPEFYSGLFEKVGVKPKVFKVGTFKSATEQYTEKKMSDSSRYQTQVYLDEFWDIYKDAVAESRNMSPSEVDALAESFIFGKGDKALKDGFIDGIAIASNLRPIFNRAIGEEDLEKAVPFLSFKKYMQAKKEGTGNSSRNRIAVIFAEGTITSGKSSDGTMGSATIVQELRKARHDDKIKAVVLRVNSPGGSIIASDIMAKEIELLKAAGKPIIASMGSVAASGGYYISAPCDKIYAQPNTITGSIGIFGIMLNTEELFTENLGISFDEVATHKYTNIGVPVRPMSDAESAFIQANVNDGYSTFIHLVRENRNFPDSASVDKIAQGRVWTGQDALGLGLVDEMGQLDDAIEAAAEAAELEDYKVKLLPAAKSPFEEIMKSLTGQGSLKIEVDHPLKKELEKLEKLKRAIPSSGVYALMPYVMEYN